jgi:2-phospho-L-lactate guanylyltransferase
VLVVPADLPLLTAEDVQALLDCLNGDPLVALAPDRQDQGTNALLIAPPGGIPFRFGPASFVQHCRLALEAGARLEIVRRATLALDLDVPEDLALLEEIQATRADSSSPHLAFPSPRVLLPRQPMTEADRKGL